MLENPEFIKDFVEEAISERVNISEHKAKISAIMSNRDEGNQQVEATSKHMSVAKEDNKETGSFTRLPAAGPTFSGQRPRHRNAGCAGKNGKPRTGIITLKAYHEGFLIKQFKFDGKPK